MTVRIESFPKDGSFIPNEMALPFLLWFVAEILRARAAGEPDRDLTRHLLDRVDNAINQLEVEMKKMPINMVDFDELRLLFGELHHYCTTQHRRQPRPIRRPE